MTTKTQLEEILSKFPPSTQNNARKIARAEIEFLMRKMREQPCGMWARRLEEWGVCVDYDDSDWGTGERGEFIK